MTTAAQIHHQFHHQGGVHHEGGAHHQGWGSPCRSGGQHRFEVTSRGSPLRQGHQRRGVTTKVERQRRGITTKGRSPSLPPRRVTTKAGLVISRTGVTTKAEGSLPKWITTSRRSGHQQSKTPEKFTMKYSSKHINPK